MERLHIHLHLPQRRVVTLDDAAFESEHPRNPDGEFSSAGAKGKASAIKAPKKARTAAAVKWTKQGGGKFTPAEHQRLRALGVPPAWTRITLSSDPNAKLQVTGYDEKGRQQRRYSAEHTKGADAAKFARLKAFHGVAGKIITAAQQDMTNTKLPQDVRDAAAIVRLISVSAFRIGSDRDTKAEKKAYGASTLQKSHVKVGTHGAVSFTFPAKSGKTAAKTITDHELARYIKAKAKGEGDRLFNVPASKVRAYLKSKSSTEFKVKDFRTWHGTNEALKELEKHAEPTNAKEFAALRTAVAKKVAEHLGNTPAVALKSYIDPAVFNKWSHLA